MQSALMVILENIMNTEFELSDKTFKVVVGADKNASP
jgi:hypothetical protein